MGWRDLSPSEGVGEADWIRRGLHQALLLHDLGTVIPQGFDAYARILHPAPGAFGAEVRWSEVAAWNEKTVHAEMQFHAIGGPWNGMPQGMGPRVGQPSAGRLSDRQARILVDLLEKHTATRDSCWLCLWDGQGSLHPSGTEPPVLPKNRVKLPDRDYVLFNGSVAGARGWAEGPNLWWPNDRAWCVVSEVHVPCTYVGGTGALIERILAHSELEALPAKLSDGITIDSDRINSP